MTSRYIATALVAVIAFILFALMVTGCGAPVQLPSNAPLQGAAIRGSVHGGQQPVSGAHVYLFAANTTGYAGNGATPSSSNASISLLSSADTGNSDSVGAYVLTGSDGSFGIGGDYTCTPGQQVYLYALGGNPGAGTNSYDSFMAVLGNCPSAGNFATATPTVQMNEVTTVAAAYAIAGYAYDATHVSSSGTTLAKVGIANAFANAANLVDISTGMARTTTPAGNGTVPTSTIYTIANILGACVNSADQTFMIHGNTITAPSAACTTLLNTATTLGNGTGSDAGDTAGAAINIAHYPSDSISTLYNLPNGNYAFGGGLTTQPSDFSLSLNFTGGGMGSVQQLAIDASGDVWLADSNGPNGNGGLAELSPLGAILSPSSAEWTDASLNDPQGIVLDKLLGYVWLPNYQGHTISVFDSTGTFQFTVSALSNSLLSPKYLAFDRFENLWVGSSDGSTNSLKKFLMSGSYYGTYTGNGLGQSNSLVIDGSGHVWVSSGTEISEFNGSGAAAGSSPFTAGISSPIALALDSSNQLWVLNGNTSVTLLNSSGGVVSGTPYNTGSSETPIAEAIDGAGSDWIVESVYNSTTQTTAYSLIAISGSGSVLSSSSGYTLNGSTNSPRGIAIDGSGDVWLAGGSKVQELVGMATPVVTPVVANLISPYSAPASKP